MYPMTNSHLTDNRHTDYINSPVQIVKDQMSQCILKSEYLTVRNDHWHKDQEINQTQSVIQAKQIPQMSRKH